MKSFKHMLLYLGLATLAFDCNASDDTNTTPVRPYADVKQDFSMINFSTGTNDVSLIGLNNEFCEFRVIMPDVNFTNTNRPLY